MTAYENHVNSVAAGESQNRTIPASQILKSEISNWRAGTPETYVHQVGRAF